MTFTRETLGVFSFLLTQVRLDPASEDLQKEAELIANARKELLAALSALDKPKPRAKR